jgi:hypothetical protein
MMRPAQTAAILAALLAPCSALADAGAAGSCAAGLPAEAKAIYDAAAPDFVASADPRALVKAKTMDLVKTGAVQRGSARSSAMTAGNCLKKLR